MTAGLVMNQDVEPKAKRRKIDDSLLPPTSGDSVRSVGDLQNALHFRQSSSHEVKRGIQTFKDFLSAIGKSEDTSAQAEKLRVLKGYCDSQSNRHKHTLCFNDLISTWAFAVQVKNDSLLSAVPAVLAQFLKTVSTRLEFRDFGVTLCKGLLQKDQLQLLDRGLTATKTKEHLISPCLRLLTEIVSFDGGAVASNLYSQRDIAFKRLDFFLSQKGADSDKTADGRRRPTLRRIAQRYVLANLRFQSVSARGDIIAQGKILRAFLQGIIEDGADIVSDILQTIKSSIVNDPLLSRNLKTRFINQPNLTAISTLYGFVEPLDEQADGREIRTQAHKFLHLVCTQHEKGILLPQTGWYPVGTNPEAPISDISENDPIDLGLDSPLNFDCYQDKVPVKNGTLSMFIQSLRPETNSLQASLILDIFQAAPELVADYFSKKDKFTSEAKDSASWLGQAGFLFSTIQLPVPPFGGWKDSLPKMPPPLSIVIESILPRPLDRATVTKCFNMNHEVITLFALRAMSVAFQKLQQILEMFTVTGSDSHLWHQAASKLVTLFSQRAPQTKDVISVLQRAPKTDLNLRGASIELLAMYFQLLPHSALSEKFDVSLAIADLISRLEADAEGSETKELLLEQLNNLLQISQLSTNTRWWQKPEVLKFSPFCSMLRIVTETDNPSRVINHIKDLLQSLLLDNGILRRKSRDFDVLVGSLRSSKKWVPEVGTFSFMDNCMSRIVRQPVHYQDLHQSAWTGIETSLLVVSVAEQWPFVAKSNDAQSQKNVAGWIARLVVMLDAAEGGMASSTQLQDGMLRGTNGEMRDVLLMAFEKQRKISVILKQAQDDEEIMVDTAPAATSAENDAETSVLETVFGAVHTSPTVLEGLDKWDKTDFDFAIASGRLSRLTQCLASAEAEVRRQAFITLSGLMQQVEESTYPEKQPVYILLGEMCETVKDIGIDSKPVPSIVVEVAAEALLVLADPAHQLYCKINKFLNKGPIWETAKLLPYWIDRILLREPEGYNTGNDNGQTKEVDWILTLLINALRSSEDMELYRRANVFERILSLYSSPSSKPDLRHKILHVIYRAVKVGGKDGANAVAMTLMTRAAISSLLKIQLALISAAERGVSKSQFSSSSSSQESAILRQLKRALEEACDADGDDGRGGALRKWQLRVKEAAAAEGSAEKTTNNMTSGKEEGDGGSGVSLVVPKKKKKTKGK